MREASVRKTVINAGECVFEPFYDPALSGFSKWVVTPGGDYGLRVWQNWCYVAYEWARPNPAGPELRMTRELYLECAAYDALIISLTMPQKSVMTVSLETDAGGRTRSFASHDDKRKEYALELDGAKHVTRVTLEIASKNEGAQHAWINWFGLVNHEGLALALAEHKCWDSRWEGYLVPEDTPLSFTPQLGLLVSDGELEKLRERHGEHLQKNGGTPILDAARAAAKLAPEEMIHGNVNFWDDTRYNRDRDHGKLLVDSGVAACTAGILMKDEGMMRLAARYAMALAVTREYDNPICYTPGGVFEHRCFVHSLCAYDMGFILDMAGELFTDAAKALIRRRIAENMLGAVNFNVWQHEYIFHCNQLAWFSAGRLMGYAALLATMPRVGKYMDLAFEELTESVSLNILPDGGYVEGPTYFTTIGYNANMAFYLYARAKKLDFMSVLPETIKRTADFAEVFCSTDEQRDMIPVCDCGPVMPLRHLAFMAGILPGSQWVRIYRKALARMGGSGDTLLGLKLDMEIPGSAPAFAPFVMLPEMRAAASCRELDGEPVKLLVLGNRAGAGHTHEDKGSFVLEFAGETYALEPGTCDYSSPLHILSKGCQFHNTLIPYGMAERPHPNCPCGAHIDVTGSGDAVGAEMSVDAGLAWSEWYARWNRRIFSPDPGALEITDRYELKDGEGVYLNWMTALPVDISGSTAVIRGKKGVAEVSFPGDCELTMEPVVFFGGAVFHRIMAKKAGRSGVIVTRVALRGITAT